MGSCLHCANLLLGRICSRKKLLFVTLTEFTDAERKFGTAIASNISAPGRNWIFTARFSL